jgi:hypothetical protein
MKAISAQKRRTNLTGVLSLRLELRQSGASRGPGIKFSLDRVLRQFASVRFPGSFQRIIETYDEQVAGFENRLAPTVN